MKSVNWINLKRSLQESDIGAEAWVIRSQSNEDGGMNIPDGEKSRANTLRELGMFEE